MCLMAGRGAGKTHAILARIKFLTTIYRKFHYVYIGPTQNHAASAFRELCSDPDYKRFILRAAKRDPHPQVILKNGSTVVFRTFGRAEAIRGGNDHEVCFDESQDPIYTEAAIDEILIPMLRVPSPAGGRGVLLMAGQFRGDDWRKNQYYNYGIEYLRDGSPNPLYKPDQYRSWRVPSSEGYTYKTPGGPELYARERERVLSAHKKSVWEQEYECIENANRYAAFPPEQITSTIRGNIEEQPRENENYLVAADLGRRIDPTSVIVGDSQNRIVYEEIFPLNQDHILSARQVARIALKYNKAPIVVDSTGGATGGKQRESFVELYRAEADICGLTVFDVWFNYESKRRMIDNLSIAFARNQIGIPGACVNTLRQLRAYEYRLKSAHSKLYEYAGPRGTHDDLVAALAMYWEGVLRGWIANNSGTPYKVA